MGNRFLSTNEARAELTAAGAHLEIGGNRFTMADTAGHEDRHVVDLGQNLLG